MGQKDLTAKDLECRPDVFADIINALIYQGRQVVQPENLKPAPTETLYEDMHRVLCNQYNDVSKYEVRQQYKKQYTRRQKKKYSKRHKNHYEKQRIRIQYTLENESSENYKMVLRKAGYEGAVYRSEYDAGEVYPVVVLVLYWGKKKWNPYSDLYELFADGQMDAAVVKHIDNVKLHMFSMTRLPKQIRQRFRSDMRIVVDYLAEGAAYEPSDQTIRYVEQVMRLLYALTGDALFINSIAELLARQEKEGEVTMCEVIDKFEERGRQRGIQQGIQQGLRQGVKKGLHDGARAFIATSINRKAGTDYILEMVQECFGFNRDEAVALYRECRMQYVKP